MTKKGGSVSRPFSILASVHLSPFVPMVAGKRLGRHPGPTR